MIIWCCGHYLPMGILMTHITYVVTIIVSHRLILRLNISDSLSKQGPWVSMCSHCGLPHIQYTVYIMGIYIYIYICIYTVYPKKYAHGFCFAVLCCGYTLTDFPISIRLTSLALWQSNDCPSASKATLMNMDKYFMWIHYERLHNHNKAKHNKPVCIFLGIYCILPYTMYMWTWFLCYCVLLWLGPLCTNWFYSCHSGLPH